MALDEAARSQLAHLVVVQAERSLVLAMDVKVQRLLHATAVSKCQHGEKFDLVAENAWRVMSTSKPTSKPSPASRKSQMDLLKRVSLSPSVQEVICRGFKICGVRGKHQARSLRLGRWTTLCSHTNSKRGVTN